MQALLALFQIGAAAAALDPTILADTNRDGSVDLKDAEGKATWTLSRGAIFLPNIGDTDHRCSSVDRNGNPLSDDELVFCNDAAGDIVYAPEYLAPLRTLPINGSEQTYATISAHPEEHARHVRIFWHSQGSSDVNTSTSTSSPASEWRHIPPSYRFNATALRAGLALGLDARSIVSDTSSWNGTITVHFSVTDPTTANATATDAVALRLAPVLTHHHLQPARHLLTVQGPSAPRAQRDFVASLDRARRDTALLADASLVIFDETDDIWAQDFLEPAYASMPGPNDTATSIRVLLRSAQHARPAGRQLWSSHLLCGRGVAAYGGAAAHASALGWREINSGGNIETMPPYTSALTGRRYPAGRVVVGKHWDARPAEGMVLGFLGRQWEGLQEPLVLEAGWLAIGHVDEFVQFLPAAKEEEEEEGGLGWTVAVADPMAGLDVLREVEQGGHETARARSNGPPPEGGESDGGLVSNDNVTVAELLADDRFLAAQEIAQRQIDDNVRILLKETGLTEEDVVRVPTLFEELDVDGFGMGADWEDGLPPRYGPFQPDQKPLAAFYPAAINGIVIGNDYIAARAFGPVIEGKDVLQAAVEEVYANAGMRFHAVDDFYSHHVNGGEVHCGTNTLRDTAMAWWNEF